MVAVLQFTFKAPCPEPAYSPPERGHSELGCAAVSTEASILSALIFGLPPALRPLKLDVSEDLLQGNAMGNFRTQVRRVLVIAEVAFAWSSSRPPAIGAELLRLTRVNAGFRAGRARLMLLLLSEREYRAETVRQMLDRVRVLPGVVATDPSGVCPSKAQLRDSVLPEPTVPTRPRCAAGGNVSIIRPGI